MVESGTVAAASQTVELAIKASNAYQRPGLAARAERALARLRHSDVRVLVVGEFKQGKSQLINAMVNAPVCPVDDDVATAVPTVVRYAPEPTVNIVRGKRSEDGENVVLQDPVRVPIEKLAEHVSEAGNPGNRENLQYAEVGIPRRVLENGLELVDTPGVGGLGSAHGSATMAVLPTADAILLVSDAANEYTRPELEFLRQAARLCPNVACVLSKTDLYPEWRRISELNRGHLQVMGIADAELLPVSSTLRLHAVAGEDSALNAESGYPELMTFLRDRVLGQQAELASRATGNDVVAIAEQLAASMRSELEVLQDPDQAEAKVEALRSAKDRASALKDRTARWQQTLNDGIADLNADIDYDLRDRMREIIRESELDLDAVGDPQPVWEQFSEDVYQRVAAATSANFLWTSERVQWLAGQVAGLFAEDGAEALPELHIGSSELLSTVQEMQLPTGEKFGVGQKAMSGLRGGYIGTLMFGMMSTFAGFALLNPLSAVAGVLMGGKTVRDEKHRVIERRRSEAKAALRRYIDEVQFQVGTESREMLRKLQRELRDHFTAQAEELGRSLQESVRAAENAMRADENDRTQRATDLRAELERITNLEKMGRELIPSGQTL